MDVTHFHVYISLTQYHDFDNIVMREPVKHLRIEDRKTSGNALSHKTWSQFPFAQHFEAYWMLRL